MSRYHTPQSVFRLRHLALALCLMAPAATIASETDLVFPQLIVDRAMNIHQPEPVQVMLLPIEQTAVIPLHLISAKTIEPMSHVKAKKTKKKQVAATTSEPERLYRKQVRIEQQSGNHYRQSISLIQQGRIAEAKSELEKSLKLKADNHDARLVLSGLLLEQLELHAALAVLNDGLTITPGNIEFRMAIARINVELQYEEEALRLLADGVTYAGESASYHLFYASMLRRAGQDDLATKHYIDAIKLGDQMTRQEVTSALVGMGISLQKTGHLAEARELFSRAQATAALNDHLAEFVSVQVKLINQQLEAGI